VLFLDSDGAPVVAELKRGEAPDTVDLQALKYAAYCSQLTVEDLIDAYSRHRDLGKEDARIEVFDHAPSLRSSELRPVRVRLVAETFGPSVTTTVLWLRDVGLDIGCVEISPRSLPDGGYVGLEVDLGRGEVHAIAQAGEGDGIGVVPLLPESAGDSLPTPSSQPTTADQDVCCHLQDLLLRPRAGFG
jgi:hypothetical protein